MCECERCKKKESRTVRIEWNPELEQYVCGECWTKWDDAMDAYEDTRRERLERENEY